MPIKIQSDLPARNILENENIFVMTEQRAEKQDIRPLKIAIVNLMPTKIATETQLLRLLANSPIQVEISLVHMEAHLLHSSLGLIILPKAMVLAMLILSSRLSLVTVWATPRPAAYRDRIILVSSSPVRAATASHWSIPWSSSTDWLLQSP